MSKTPFAIATLTLLATMSALAQLTGSQAGEAIISLNQPRDASYVGNSVDTGTGAFSMQANALTLNGGRPLSFTLLFDSIEPPAFIVARSRSLGAGWTHPYSARIQGNPESTVTVWWDDNRRNTFQRAGSGYLPRQEAVRYDRLTRESDGEWRLVRPDGTEYRFDEDGLLLQIANKARQAIKVERDGRQRIAKLVEPLSGKEIEFHYSSAVSRRIAYLADPAGRETHFLYDETGRIRALHNPTRFDPAVGDFFVPKPIPDNSPTGLIHRIRVNRTEPMGLLRIPVFSVEHHRLEDLQIVLASPEGTAVELQDLLDRPSENAYSAQDLVLQEFEGENPNGEWRLLIVDRRGGSTGRLNGIRIELSDRTFPTHLRYDPVRLVEALDADGERIFANSYDAIGRVIAQDDGRTETPPATFEYGLTSTAGVLTTYTGRDGAQQLFEHDDSYHLIRYVDPLGAETRYSYNDRGDRIRIEDPLGRVTTFDYDQDGNVVRVVDPALNVSRMEYDTRRNMTLFTDAAGFSTRFNYNNGNVTEVRDALGHRTRKTYNNGQLVQNMLHDDAGVQYTYSGGMVVGAQRMDVRGDKVERTDYDALGYPTSLTDAERRETKLEYDERLNVVARINPLGDRETKEFDVRNRLVRIVDFNGNETRMHYDGNSNLVARTNALGQTSTYRYDAEDRLIETIDPLGATTWTVYDAAGRPVEQIDGVGGSTRTEYDAVGNVIAVYDGEDNLVRSAVYDELDLPVEVTDALGNTIKTVYDELGNVVRIIDKDGSATQLRYDELSRLIEVEDPSGRIFKREYFSDDVIKAIEDAKGIRTSFSYDQGNRLTRIEPYAGRVAATEFRYDEAYQLIRDDLPGGARREYEYDGAGRITRIVYTGENRPGNRKLTYDANGNLLRVRVEAGGGDRSGVQLERTYDALNRVIELTDAHGTTVGYQYDAAGNLETLTYPDGRTVDYVYNQANQLVELVDWSDRRTRFSYDSNSRVTRIEFPNGVVRSMIYDEAGRLRQRKDTRSSGSVIVQYDYEYDEQGRVTVEAGGLSQSPYRPEAMTMNYLPDGRLTMVNGFGIEYDARHNIIGAPLDGQPFQFEYNVNNRLTRANGFEYEYDAADNLIGWRGPDGRTRLSINPQAALTQVLMKRDGDGTSHRYVYAGGLLYDEVDGKIRVYHYDYRGNSVAFTDSAGRVSGRVSYGPFGEISSRSGDSDSIFLHGGLWGIITDHHTGLQYMRFRWYAPQLKRFLSKDAHVGDIASPATLNRYAYGGNDPVNFNDPTGEFLNLVAGAIGAAAGAVIGVAVTVTTKAIAGERITAGDIIGSAVGGAITGGLTGLCAGVCGPAAFLAGSVVAGALGAGAENAIGQGVDIATGVDEDGRFDTQGLGVDIAAGAVFGAIPFGGKGGKAVTKGLGRGAFAGASRGAAKGAVGKGVRKAVTPVGAIPIPIPKAKLGGRTIYPGIAGRSAVQDAAASQARKSAVKGFLGAFLLDMAVGSAQDAFVSLVTGDASSPSGTEPYGAARVQSVARQEINAGNRGVYGEHTHWGLYQSFHQLVGAPLPNNPNNPLAEF